SIGGIPGLRQEGCGGKPLIAPGSCCVCYLPRASEHQKNRWRARLARAGEPAPVALRLQQIPFQTRPAVRAGVVRTAPLARARIHRDVAAGLDDAIERTAIDGQIADDRERGRPKRLDGDVIAVLELAHVELARGCALFFTVRNAVDGESAGAADAFSTITLEG